MHRSRRPVMKSRAVVTCLLATTAATQSPAATNISLPFELNFDGGSASWGESTNSLAPCSRATAFANAVAGDLVNLRGGAYHRSATLMTAHGGRTGGHT